MAEIMPHLAELAARINAEHQKAATAFRASLEHARNAGELLLAAKKQCGHGRWLPWLRENVTFSERTAQTYMQVAKRWSELTTKAQPTADLTIEDGLKLLASPRVDVDGNLQRATSLLSQAAEDMKNIPPATTAEDVERLMKIKNIAEDCIQHATAVKIDNLAELGGILREQNSAAMTEEDFDRRLSEINATYEMMLAPARAQALKRLRRLGMSEVEAAKHLLEIEQRLDSDGEQPDDE